VIDQPLERLLSAYCAAGGTLEPDPVSDRELAKLRKLVAPLRLPDELVGLWQRFQNGGPPGIIDTLWLDSVELAIGAAPYAYLSRALLIVASGGSSRCYLELHDADGNGGGAVWRIEEFAPEMHEVAPSLPALLEADAIAWERGVARLSDRHPFPFAVWDEPAWARLKAEVLPPPRVAGSRPSRWLPRWLAAEGLTAADVAPHGATTTIRDLLGRGAWTGVETIRGRVRSAAGNQDDAAVTVDDETGSLDVYLPHAADRFGLANLGREVEVDVVRPTKRVASAIFDTAAFPVHAVTVRDV